MAKANWLNVSPAQGNGNASVNVSTTTPHTGRLARTTTLTWTAVNVEDIVRTVNQAGKPEYVDIEGNATADKEGKRVTISGMSNSRMLVFSFGSGDLDITMPTHFMANSVATQVNPPVAIAGDPGAKAEYPFSITIDVPANDGIKAKTRQIIVQDESGFRDICLLTSAAGDAYVLIAEGDIELDYLGTPVTVAVESNTTWSIE